MPVIPHPPPPQPTDPADAIGPQVPPGRRQEAQNDLVMSFNLVRRALGVLGLSLPVLLLLVPLTSDEPWYASISEFYHGRGGDLFVGIMCALGVFLFSYVGYRDPRFPSDRLMARVAGTAAVLVAFVPTEDKTRPIETGCSLLSCAIEALAPGYSPGVHYAAAGVFLASLAVMCLVNFRRMSGAYASAPELAVKLRKNAAFLNCGVVICGAILALALFALVYRNADAELQRGLDGARIVFWLEAVAVWAFAWAWLIKGEVPMIMRMHGIEDP